MQSLQKEQKLLYKINFSDFFILNDGNADFNKTKKTKYKILIVDDEEIILDMYEAKFKSDGFTVFKASNGQEGLAVAKKEKPDIILTDIVMPKFGGFYLLKNIKNNPELKNIPVITLSNADDANHRQKACELGTLYYLVKSECLPKDIANITQEVLAIKRGQKKL